MARVATVFGGSAPMSVSIPESGGTLTNLGPGTLYYGSSRTVSDTANDGSLGVGASTVLYGATYLYVTRADARADVDVTPLPTAAGTGSGAAFGGCQHLKSQGLRQPVASEPTWTDQTATSIASGTTVASTVAGPALNPNAPFRYSAGDPVAFSATQVLAYANTYHDGTRPILEGFPLRVDFEHDGQAFEILQTQRPSTGNRLRLFVDGRVTAYHSVPTGAASAFTKVDFGSVAKRRITIDFDYKPWFVGVRIGITDAIMPPSWSGYGKFAVLGDSYAAGVSINYAATSGSYSTLGYPYQVADLLGFSDFRNYGVGGTGFIQTPGNSAPIYADRIPDLARYQPDVCYVQGSLNDGGQSAANEQAAAAAFWTAARAALPNTRFVTSGPVAVNSGSGYTNMNTGVRAAALAAGVPFIDTLGQAVFTGTGNTGSLRNDGNADVYRDTDNVHPTARGQLAIAPYLAGQIATSLRLSA